MIPERKVLSRIEDLEQCGRRIAAKIHAKLVYFIKHHHRIIYVCPAQRLDNAAGHRADISASMSAKLGFIAHAAQRHALEFAAHRSGDRLSEAGLADAWRANEAEYWCFGFWVELDHRKMLEDSLFDVFQIVVIFIEHGLGVIEIQTLFGRFPPRQIENPLEICSDHVIIRRSRGQPLEAVEFALGFSLAKLFLDLLHLLAQDVIALSLAEFFLSLIGDLAADLQDLDLTREVGMRQVKQFALGVGLEQRLFLSDLEVQHRAEKISEPYCIIRLNT